MVEQLQRCYWCFSILARDVIEKAVKMELKGKEIAFDTVLHGKDCVEVLLHNHIESIICSSDTEVLLAFTRAFYGNSVCTCAKHMIILEGKR